MSGLIRREDIPYVDLNSDMPHSSVRVFVAFKESIDVLPSADAVEVVRCKDCKYWREWENRVGSCHRSENRYNWFGVDSTDYCSFGERREPYKGGDDE